MTGQIDSAFPPSRRPPRRSAKTLIIDDRTNVAHSRISLSAKIRNQAEEIFVLFLFGLGCIIRLVIHFRWMISSFLVVCYLFSLFFLRLHPSPRVEVFFLPGAQRSGGAG